MTTTRTCANPDCAAEFTPARAARKYCRRGCNLSIARRSRIGGTHCRSGKHEMTEDNIRRDAQGRRRGCKACAAARDGQRVSTKNPRAGRPKRPRVQPAPPPVPAPVPVVATRTIWRPAGWSHTPDARRSA